MPIQPDISLQAKVPQISDVMGNISSIINAKQGMLNLQTTTATQPAVIAQTKAQSRTAQAEANVAEQTQAPRVAAAKATAQQAQTQADQAKLNYLKEHYNNAIQQTTDLIQDPQLTRNKVLESLVRSAQNFNIPSAAMAQVISTVPDSNDPQELRQYLKNKLLTIQDKANQLKAVTPQVQMVPTGQEIQPQNINPLAGPVGQQIGQPTQQQLPPGTPVFNTQTNAPGFLGPQGKGVQSGPALGQAENIGGTVDVVNKDWAQTVAQAAPAAQNIGVLQNIKQLAPGAVTGVVNDKRSFISGLAGLIGMSPAQLQKTDTDLLAKNSNMLALTGGNTDAARALAEGANPNTHMTVQAITHAADQVIAQQQMLVAKQTYMGQFKGNPDAYNKALAQFNAVADPRVFQLQTMTPQEKSAMKSAMNPKERQDFGNKIRALQAMGLIQ